MLFKVSSFQQKNYETHKGTRKYHLYTEKKQSIETVPEGFHILDLLDKDFKSVFITVFKELK